MDAAEGSCLDFGALERVNVRGVNIELFRAGSGPPLFFLHGIDCLEGAAVWLKELSKSFTVYAPSHPGFGESELPVGMNRVDDLSYFYFDLLDMLGLDAPTIVGTSFGAWVACEMLTKEPSRARALVLVSPLGIKTAQRREHWVTDIFMISRTELAERLQLDAPEGANLLEMSETQLLRKLRAEEALSLYCWSPYMCNPKLADRLHRVTVPTLVVWGDRDALIEPEYSLRWRDAMPQAQVELMSGAGHRIHADKNAQLTALVSQFVVGAAK